MQLKSLIILILMIPLCFSGGNYLPLDLQAENNPVEYKLVVKVIDDEWRVVWEDDETKSDVTLRRGDRIRWVVEGSDASFQFPEIKIFGLETRAVKANNPLVMAVSNNSPSGNFPYTVFVHESMTYARGQSPPRIIIMQ